MSYKNQRRELFRNYLLFWKLCVLTLQCTVKNIH